MANKYRFHVIGLPYVPVSKAFEACAFTNRAHKFCEMMVSAGHEVFLYGMEGSDAKCDKFVQIASYNERDEWFGGYDPQRTYYTKQPVQWNPKELCWQVTNVRAAYWVKRNLAPLPQRNFLCIIGGDCQQQIHTELGNIACLLTVEYGIGYLGTFAPYRAFDSYAHQAHILARQRQDPDGQWFDAVIPNCYRVEEFPLRELADSLLNPYCLYLGRITLRKGVGIAVEACRRAGVRLKIAGQGVKEVRLLGGTPEAGCRITAEDGQVYEGQHLEYVGYISGKEKLNLLAGATALLAPSHYLEPLGGVAIEAMMCGTPAITSDWGAFSDTIEHGVTGYRCRTMEQFDWAVCNIGKLNRHQIAYRARSLWSMERVSRMYQEWFDMLATLPQPGFYAHKSDRSELDWLREDCWRIGASGASVPGQFSGDLLDVVREEQRLRGGASVGATGSVGPPVDPWKDGKTGAIGWRPTDEEIKALTKKS